MAVAPDTPVLVGFGELVRRPGEGGEEPAALMAEAVRLAVADAGSDALLRRAGVLAGIPSAGWPDGDPARRVAELLGPRSSPVPSCSTPSRAAPLGSGRRPTATARPARCWRARRPRTPTASWRSG
jgi:acetyl-CoA C-acetyltransferase